MLDQKRKEQFRPSIEQLHEWLPVGSECGVLDHFQTFTIERHNSDRTTDVSYEYGGRKRYTAFDTDKLLSNESCMVTVDQLLEPPQNLTPQTRWTDNNVKYHCIHELIGKMVLPLIVVTDCYVIEDHDVHASDGLVDPIYVELVFLPGELLFYDENKLNMSLIGISYEKFHTMIQKFDLIDGWNDNVYSRPVTDIQKKILQLSDCKIDRFQILRFTDDVRCSVALDKPDRDPDCDLDVDIRTALDLN